MNTNILHKSISKYRENIDPNKKYNVIACIYGKNNKLLSVGYNQYKTHPIQHKYALRAHLCQKIFLHAEISALLKCRSKPYTLFVMRFRHDKSIGLAKPCLICQIALTDYNINNIYFTTYTSYLSVL